MTFQTMPTAALANCRRLFLKDFVINMNIGVHDFEKKGEQRVIVNVDLYIPLELNTPSADDLTEVVDYDFMRQTIADIIADGHIQLQETFCDEIVKRMLAHPRVQATRVSTEKPDVYPDCLGVGVEVFRSK